MTTLFIVAVILCSSLAFCQLGYPFYRRHALAKQDTPASLATWYHTQVQELTAQWQNHEISQDLYQQNTLALQREWLLCQSTSPSSTTPYRLPQYGYAWLIIALLCVAISIGFYWQQGSAQAQIGQYRLLKKNQQAEQFLKTIGGVNQLQAALQDRLQRAPNDAHGWYLLGRLYLHDNQWDKAIQAFNRADHLQPHNSDTELSLAEALYLSHKPAQSLQAKDCLQRLLKREPLNPGALNLLALLAYQNHDYQRAIDLWQDLANQVPAGSDTAIALQKAIQQASQSMQHRAAQPAQTG